MPSRYSSGHSVSDAEELVSNLGIGDFTVPIEAAHSVLENDLVTSIQGELSGIAGENLQARIRGLVLMSLANTFGWLVLTTGNKSEAAVGYSTLYGDSVGAYAPIKDVYKTMVYELANWRNNRDSSPVIPANVITKAPSAELRPDQRDDESLPPYEVLDPLLEAYIEGDRNRAELVNDGFDMDLVEEVARLVDRAEYKRRQSPPGVRVSQKGFGRDRRLPLVNRYSG
jgi:NAD+ synthase (glutamine-hydrolysing)